MAVIIQEGFDSATDTDGDGGSADVLAYCTDKYPGSTLDTGADVRAQAGWGGGKCLSMGKDGSAGSNFLRVAVPEAGTYYVMFAYNPKINVGTDEIITFRHLGDGVQHITIQMLTGTRIRALRGSGFGTTLATTDNVMRPGRWNHIRVKVIISDTVGEVSIWVNGTQVMNETGIDTRNAGSGDDLDTIDFVGSAATITGLEGETCFDDIVISDTEITDILKVEDLLPDSAGDNTDWTPDTGSNFQRVDEVPKDGDTSYVESSTSSEVDLYNMGSLSTITGNIAAVQVNVDARVTAGSENIRTKLKTGTTTSDGASQAVSDTSNYDTFYEIEETDPDTASPWSVSGVNGMQCGVERL